MKIKETLAFLVALGVTAALSAPLPFEVSITAKDKKPRPEYPEYKPYRSTIKPESKVYITRDNTLREPRSTFERTVKAICDTALSMTFGSDKLNEAKKIYSLVEEQDRSWDLPDTAANYAIEALNLICGTMTFSSDKAKVTDLICKINSEHLWSD